MVCVSQAPYLFDESIHVLKFASIASLVTVEQFKEPLPVKAASHQTTSRFSSMQAAGWRPVPLVFGGPRMLSTIEDVTVVEPEQVSRYRTYLLVQRVSG